MTTDGRLCGYEFPHGPSRGKQCLGDLEQDIHYESPWYDPSTQGVATTHHFQPFERRKGERRIALADNQSPEPARDEPQWSEEADSEEQAERIDADLDAALALPGEALRTALEAVAREAATLVAEEPYGDQGVAIDARMRLRARLTELSDLRAALSPAQPVMGREDGQPR